MSGRSGRRPGTRWVVGRGRGREAEGDKDAGAGRGVGGTRGPSLAKVDAIALHALALLPTTPSSTIQAKSPRNYPKMAKENDNAHKEQKQQKEDAVTTDSASPPDKEGPPESSKRNENESNESAATEAKKKQKREHNKLKANAHGAHDVDDDKTLELMREKARAEGRTAVGSYRPRSIPKRTRLQGTQQGSSSSGPGTSTLGGYPAAYSIEGLASGSHATHQHAGQTTAAGLHAPHHAQPPIYNIISQYWYGNFDDEDLADPAEWHVMPTVSTRAS